MSLPNKKILLVASYGGHWVQLRRASVAFAGLNLHYVSTSSGLATEVSPHPFSYVPDANLNEKLKLGLLAVRMFFLMIKIRPDFVISTGAAPGFFALMFGKLVGAKTIWLDSCANAEKLSVSGGYVKPFADLWLTQWSHLAKEDGPLYLGAVI